MNDSISIANTLLVGWTVTDLSELITYGSSITYGVVQPGPEVVEGVKFVRGGDIFGGVIAVDKLRTISQRVSKTYNRTLLSGGELLMSLVGYPGEVAIVPNELAGANIARQAALLRIDKRHHAKYVMYFLLSDIGKQRIFEHSNGSAQQVVNLADLKHVRVNVPPLAEQRKIAKILTTLDTLIEKTEALIAKYKAIKQGMVHDFFTRGVDAHGRLRPPQTEAPDRYKQSELGWIPKEWETHSLTEIASYQTGQAFPSADYCDEGIPLLRPGNLQIGEYVRWDRDHTTCLPHKWESLAAEYLVSCDEVVMNLTAQSLEDQFLCRVCITPPGTRCLLNQRLARFRPKKCHLPFLFWALKAPHFRFHIDRLTQGTKVQHIYNANLNSARLAVPRNVSEQERIADILFSATRTLIAEQAGLETLRQCKTGLMQDLLTGKVRVTIDEAEEVAAHG